MHSLYHDRRFGKSPCKKLSTEMQNLKGGKLNLASSYIDASHAALVRANSLSKGDVQQSGA